MRGGKCLWESLRKPLSSRRKKLPPEARTCNLPSSNFHCGLSSPVGFGDVMHAVLKFYIALVSCQCGHIQSSDYESLSARYLAFFCFGLKEETTQLVVSTHKAEMRLLIKCWDCTSSIQSWGNGPSTERRGEEQWHRAAEGNLKRIKWGFRLKQTSTFSVKENISVNTAWRTYVHVSCLLICLLTDL